MSRTIRRWAIAMPTAMSLGVAWIGAPAAAPNPPAVEVAPARRLPGEHSGFEPVVAADAEGRVVVAAMHQGIGRVVVWTSADGGKTFGVPRPPPMEARAPQHDPWLGTSGPGRFHLSLMAKRPAKERGTYVYLLTSDDGGQTWNTPQEFPTVGFDPDRPVFGVSPNGRHAAIAFAAGGPGGPLQVRFSSDGMATWAAAATPVTTPGAGGWPTGIVTDDTGRVVVGYRSKEPTAFRLQLGVTADAGRSWRRHDLGRLTGKAIGTSRQSAAHVSLVLSGVALAQGAGGVMHALSAQQPEMTEGVHVWYRRSKGGEKWSEPEKLSRGSAALRGYPALAASGLRAHAIWLEVADGWCNVMYRGSLDGGKTWSAPTALSRGGSAHGLQTEKGFRTFSGHYLGVAEDGRGAAHVVWAVCEPNQPGSRGEVWHTIVRLGR